MTLIFKVFDISKINNSSVDEDPRDKILCNEHHPFEKNHFKATIRAFSNSIKLGMKGSSGPKGTVSIFENENISHDLTAEGFKLQPVCIAVSWFVFGLVIVCLLLCITLVLTSQYPDENENYATEAIPSSNINDEEKQLPLSGMT